MIVFGSGGHTTEMLLMIGTKISIFNKYGKINFVIGHSDTWSIKKITDFYKNQGISIDEMVNSGKLEIIKVYRAREVKQSFFTSIFTTLWAMAHSMYILTRISVFEQLDLLLTNGPGTAVPICYIYWFVSKILVFNLNAKIIFVESFCRVTDLSLTGKLLRPILSKFVVQW